MDSISIIWWYCMWHGDTSNKECGKCFYTLLVVQMQRMHFDKVHLGIAASDNTLSMC